MSSYNETYYDNLASSGQCTYDTCPRYLAYFQYLPNLGGNIFFIIFFGLILLSQLGLWMKYRTTSFTVAMFFGLIGEMIGYGGRTWAHYDPFSQTAFLMYIVCLSIAPAFLSAAIYFTFGHVVRIYGAHTSRFSPLTYSRIFICCDIISLGLQSAGGGTVGGAGGESEIQRSLDILIAGLSFQVFSLVLWIVLVCDYFFISLRKVDVGKLNQEYASVRASRTFKLFLFGLAGATIAILTRSCYRVAELGEGFDSKIANEEIPYMFLEPTMIGLAVLLMTVFHPGIGLANSWRETRRFGDKEARTKT